MSLRTTVIVDGIVLTRVQVEQAMRELEKPVKPPVERFDHLQAGDVLYRGIELRYVVPSKWLQAAIRAAWTARFPTSATSARYFWLDYSDGCVYVPHKADPSLDRLSAVPLQERTDRFRRDR